MCSPRWSAAAPLRLCPLRRCYCPPRSFLVVPELLCRLVLVGGWKQSGVEGQIRWSQRRPSATYGAAPCVCSCHQYSLVLPPLGRPHHSIIGNHDWHLAALLSFDHSYHHRSARLSLTFVTLLHVLVHTRCGLEAPHHINIAGLMWRLRINLRIRPSFFCLFFRFFPPPLVHVGIFIHCRLKLNAQPGLGLSCNRVQMFFSFRICGRFFSPTKTFCKNLLHRTQNPAKTHLLNCFSCSRHYWIFCN